MDATCVQCQFSWWSSHPEILLVNSCLSAEHSPCCDSHYSNIASWFKHLHTVTIDLSDQKAFFGSFMRSFSLVFFLLALLFCHRSSPLQTTEITLCPAELQPHQDVTRPTAPLIGMYPCPLAAGKEETVIADMYTLFKKPQFIANVEATAMDTRISSFKHLLPWLKMLKCNSLENLTWHKGAVLHHFCTLYLTNKRKETHVRLSRYKQKLNTSIRH